jgi:hypothetical protein
MKLSKALHTNAPTFYLLPASYGSAAAPSNANALPAQLMIQTGEGGASGPR